MSVQDTLDDLRRDSKFVANVAAWERIPARPAREVPFPARLDNTIANLLRGVGIQKLYTHQAQAIEAAPSGHNVVVVTPTASGKTLCYNLPVIQACLGNPSARALYLFPTKALAQDQAAALNTLMAGLEKPIPVSVYDGDTSRSDRQHIRQQN